MIVSLKHLKTNANCDAGRISMRKIVPGHILPYLPEWLDSQREVEMERAGNRTRIHNSEADGESQEKDHTTKSRAIPHDFP
jgi:hypothetical protein